MAKRRKRRRFSPAQKAKIALEALKERSTLSQIASRHELHSVQVSKWKKQVLERLPELFETSKSRSEAEQQALIDSLYKEIGRLTVELDWLQKKSERLL